jgi:hypothetical protein
MLYKVLVIEAGTDLKPRHEPESHNRSSAVLPLRQSTTTVPGSLVTSITVADCCDRACSGHSKTSVVVRAARIEPLLLKQHTVAVGML